MANEIEANTIACDEGGPGGGVITILRGLIKGTQMQIMPLNSAATMGIDKRYYNLRAEMHFEAAELIRNHKVSLPDDPILIGQLAKATYSYNVGKIIVDEKVDIKPSPDRADACIIGLYALKRALPLTQTIKAGEVANQETMINTYQYGRVDPAKTGSYFDVED